MERVLVGLPSLCYIHDAYSSQPTVKLQEDAYRTSYALISNELHI